MFSITNQLNGYIYLIMLISTLIGTLPDGSNEKAIQYFKS